MQLGWSAAVRTCMCCADVNEVLFTRFRPVECTPYPPTQLPPSTTGKLEKKEHILNERDALFVDLRHKHFAAASQVGWGGRW